MYFYCTFKADQVRNEVKKELCCVCLRRISTDQVNNSAIAGEKPNSRTELIVGERLLVKPIEAICDVVQVVRGNYGIFLLSRAP